MRKARDYKIILVGDTSVGKTSIIMRFQHDVFNPNHQETVGASFITKQVEVNKELVNMNIWDTAGQEKYRTLVPMYARNASTAVIVFDVTNKQSFSNLEIWYQDLKDQTPEDCNIVIAGNKTDLEFSCDVDEIEKFVKDRQLNIFYVSALNGKGINDLFQYIIETLPTHKYKPTNEAILITSDKEKKQCC